MANKLNKRQEKFLELYLSGIMPCEAYQEAYGVKKRIAQINSCRLLTDANIQEAIAEYEKEEDERIRKKLKRLNSKAVNNIEKAIDLDENDTSLNFFKMMAIQHKTKTAENHLKRMGFDSPEKHEIKGSLDLTWKEIIYGTAESKDDSETDSN